MDKLNIIKRLKNRIKTLEEKKKYYSYAWTNSEQKDLDGTKASLARWER